MTSPGKSGSTGKRRFPLRTYLFFGSLAALLLGFGWDGSPLGGLLLRKAVDIKFATVRKVSPAELVAWTKDPSRPPPLLVDVRPTEQFSMSHIADAVQLDPANPDLALLSQVSRETPIVLYDGPGVVSTAVVPALVEAGFTRVSSLEGGLFRWVNEGHPVVDSQGPATAVHPVSFWWGRLLKGKHHP